LSRGLISRISVFLKTGGIVYKDAGEPADALVILKRAG
jgi:hypothetical protein